MKKIALLSFLFIFIASISKLHFCTADASPDTVLDTDGKKLRAGDNYYILPAFQGSGGGGLAPGNIRQGYDACHINVVQQPYEQSDGFPAKFSLINPKKGVIRVSTDLNVEFDTTTRCGKSTVWKVGKFDQYLRQFFVTVGGTKGNPGRETVENWFKIEKYGNDYKIVHCPTVCKYCKVMCKDIGIFENNGKRGLVLSDTPFPVMFKKAY